MKTSLILYLGKFFLLAIKKRLKKEEYRIAVEMDKTDIHRFPFKASVLYDEMTTIHQKQSIIDGALETMFCKPYKL